MADTPPTSDTAAAASSTQPSSAPPTFTGPASQNSIIRRSTKLYLDTLDPNNPPSPETVENELLNSVNANIELENDNRTKEQKIKILKTLTFSQIADVMSRLHKICRISPSGKNVDKEYDLVGIYQNSGPDEGIYVTAEETFRTIARQYNYDLTINEFREVMAALKDAAPAMQRCSNRDLIAVANGIFDYSTKTLQPFTPDIVFLSKSHVEYNAKAMNVNIHNDDDGTDWDVEDWMASLSDDPEIVSLLWEILGAIIRPHVRWNKSAWLYSERGNNGKGTLCELMRNLCGPNAYASIPIADFSKEFLLEPLTRASAIIVDENDVGTYIDRAANLKAVITNDVISINRKYKSPIAYQFYGFMVQCLNDYPRIKDKSESFYRRQLFIPMEKNFNGVERRYIKSDYLHRKDVLEYVLKRVLHMDYYELSEPEATKNVLTEYKSINDPVRAFWDEFEHQFVWDLLPFTFLFDLYRVWFSHTSPSGSPVGSTTFIRDLLNIVDGSDQWYCNDKKAKIRTTNRMDEPELLISEYDLKSWYNKYYTGKDKDKLCVPSVAAQYRGLLRYNSAPASVTNIGQPQNTGTDS